MYQLPFINGADVIIMDSELVPIVLFKEPIVILETELRGEKKRLMINYGIPIFGKRCSGDKSQGMGLFKFFINNLEKEVNSV